MTAKPDDRRRSETGPRERMVRAAAQLIRRQGVSGTGLREVIEQADAPRGSLQHYFPDGKTQLVSEALLMMGGVAARRVMRALNSSESPVPSVFLDAIVEDWRQDLTAEDFAAGCPLVAAAADIAVSSEPLRQTIAEAFQGWQEPLSEGLISLGVPTERAPRLAVVVLSALEGAIILARIRQSLEPLDAVVAEIGPVLDAAARPARQP